LITSAVRFIPSVVLALAVSCLLADPATAQPSSRWRARVDAAKSAAPRGVIEVSVDGGEFTPFQARGVGYQPTPLRTNINFTRWLSDTWWNDITPDPQFNPTGDPLSPARDHVTHGFSTLWGAGNQLVPGRGDLRMIKQALNVNTIRVYGMTSRLLTVRDNPPPPGPAKPPKNTWNAPNQSGPIAYVKHNQFLDECARNQIYVLVGLFLGAPIWDKSLHDNPDPDIQLDIAWYTAVYKEIVQEVGRHPAVMGFIVNNEVDGTDIVWKDPVKAEFFWNQMRAISADIKAMAPDKLVGVAFHNDETFGRHASAQMSNVPNVDFWGVNVFEAMEGGVASVFEANNADLLGYQLLPPAALKPVIFTEYGIPQTEHDETLTGCDNNLSISDAKPSVSQGVAQIIRNIGGDLIAGKWSIAAGMVYFELTDEFYKQDGALNASCIQNKPRFPAGADSSCVWIGTSAPIIATWPGRRWDEAGFGLYAVKRGINPGTRQPEPDCASAFDYLPQFDYFGPLTPDRLVDARADGGNRATARDALRTLYSYQPRRHAEAKLAREQAKAAAHLEKLDQRFDRLLERGTP